MSEEHIEPEPEPVELKSSIDKHYSCCHSLLYDHWKHKIADSVSEADDLILDLMEDDDMLQYDLDVNYREVFNSIKDEAIESCKSLDDLKQLIIKHHS